ncbi:hydrogenase maturation protease [Streptomyces sp. NPDC006739]|uniref:hydrogenase maturation protease n=1 Tax=Streptomyces sp. NPDC006739 TaxID=3364763 RepID=UPI0036C94C42
MTPTRLLVAGIGNIFLADDAFGPEVVKALGGRPLPGEVHVRDFGIRGLDLAYRLLDGYDAAVLVDAAPRGHRPGTLCLIEPEIPHVTDSAGHAPEAHGMDPVKVLALAAHLGDGALPRIVVLGCEPQTLPSCDADVAVGLSAPVGEAVQRAVTLLHTVVRALLLDPAAPLSFGHTDEFGAAPPARPPADPAGADEDRRTEPTPPPRDDGCRAHPSASKEHA